LQPSKLEEIFVDAFEDAQTTCLIPEIREGGLLEPQSDGQREISKRLQEILNTFCDELERLALERSEEESQQAPTISQLIGFPSEMLQQNSIAGEKGWGSFMSWEQRLLCCLSNCAYCNKIFFPRIGGIFAK
jgi:exocyst complex component 2